MQTRLSAEFEASPAAREAEGILRKCVHCGFCLATCPTYQLLGDELDSPRGRIYLIKEVLEGRSPGRATQEHLDRCLTCRNCETTCPSGVEFGRLVDIGRDIVEQRVERPPAQRAVRWLLREGMTSAAFAPAIGLSAVLRPLLPQTLRAKLPRGSAGHPAPWPRKTHAHKALLLAGCVQPTLMPNVNAATARVLDAAGIEVLVAAGAGCCGAVKAHLADREGALDHMRRNIDAWWPYIQPHDGRDAVLAIIANASGCGVTLKEYAHHLAHDAAYGPKAHRISELARDLAEVVLEHAPRIAARLMPSRSPLAVHVPCTLQHGQRLPQLLPRLLRELGFDAQVDLHEGHLCCGSAGTYSLLQPALSQRLRDRKLKGLRALNAPKIVSANIGCIQHLQSGTDLQVQHWVEVVDALLRVGDEAGAAALATGKGDHPNK